MIRAIFYLDEFKTMRKLPNEFLQLGQTYKYSIRNMIFEFYCYDINLKHKIAKYRLSGTRSL